MPYLTECVCQSHLHNETTMSKQPEVFVFCGDINKVWDCVDCFICHSGLGGPCAVDKTIAPHRIC